MTLLFFSRPSRLVLTTLGSALVLAACANSTFDPNEGEGANAGAAGVAAGTAGKGGSAGKAGAQAAGSGGEAGSSGAGTSGKGGAAGKGGATGKGGVGGKAGEGGEAGESGSGGTGGSAGLSGKGGSSGKGGAAGKAGTGGTAGTAGAAGQSGSAGSGNGGAAGMAQGGASSVCVYAPNEGETEQDVCFTCWNAAVASDGCKTQRAACDGDPSCAERFQCVITCAGEDSSCEKKCEQPAPDEAKKLYEALRDCVVDGDCKDSCADHASEALSLDMCKHDICTPGMILYRDCSPEVDAICDQNVNCCGGPVGKWDQGCITLAEKVVSCPYQGCVHSPCAPGAPILNKACSPCVSAICDQFPLCCSPLGKWDPACANAVATVCKDL